MLLKIDYLFLNRLYKYINKMYKYAKNIFTNYF